MPISIDWSQLVAAVLYSALGAALFIALFWVFEKLTPFSVRHEIVEEHNTALAIVIAACALALGIIVSAAIVG